MDSQELQLKFDMIKLIKECVLYSPQITDKVHLATKNVLQSLTDPLVSDLAEILINTEQHQDKMKALLDMYNHDRKIFRDLFKRVFEKLQLGESYVEIRAILSNVKDYDIFMELYSIALPFVINSCCEPIYQFMEMNENGSRYPEIMTMLKAMNEHFNGFIALSCRFESDE